jgi:hypothetical protein
MAWENGMTRPKSKIPLGWRILGILIIAISLFLGFYLKILYIQEQHKTRDALHAPPTQEMQRDAEKLNRAIQVPE